MQINTTWTPELGHVIYQGNFNGNHTITSRAWPLIHGRHLRKTDSTLTTQSRGNSYYVCGCNCSYDAGIFCPRLTWYRWPQPWRRFCAKLSEAVHSEESKEIFEDSELPGHETVPLSRFPDVIMQTVPYSSRIMRCWGVGTVLLRNVRNTNSVTLCHNPEDLNPQQHCCENPWMSQTNIPLKGRCRFQGNCRL